MRAELLDRAMDAGAGRRSGADALDRRQGIDERRRGELVDGDPLSSGPLRRRLPPRPPVGERCGLLVGW
jgi:hypothetical protein